MCYGVGGGVRVWTQLLIDWTVSEDDIDEDESSSSRRRRRSIRQDASIDAAIDGHYIYSG